MKIAGLPHGRQKKNKEANLPLIPMIAQVASNLPFGTPASSRPFVSIRVHSCPFAVFFKPLAAVSKSNSSAGRHNKRSSGVFHEKRPSSS
jgi:hypothetical protein